MPQYYVGQILMTGFAWSNSQSFAACDGQLMSVSQNSALFSVLGTAYGGNGSSNFALPNMTFCTPVGAGASQDGSWQPQPYGRGTTGGVQQVQLATANLPNHTHAWMGTDARGTSAEGRGAMHGVAVSTASPTGTETIYAPNANGYINTIGQQISPTGGNEFHQNMQPFVALNFSIALIGLYAE